MKTICIMCPMGCDLTIAEENGEIKVSGNTCARGAAYGKQEFVAPKRVVTSLVRVAGGDVLSVKTNSPIDKADIFKVLEVLASVVVEKPISIGDVIVKNVLNSGADIVATSNKI